MATGLDLRTHPDIRSSLEQFEDNISCSTNHYLIARRTSKRATSSKLCNVALDTVTPPKKIGSNLATGVIAPVRPTCISMAMRRVEASWAGNFQAVAKRGPEQQSQASLAYLGHLLSQPYRQFRMAADPGCNKSKYAFNLIRSCLYQSRIHRNTKAFRASITPEWVLPNALKPPQAHRHKMTRVEWPQSLGQVAVSYQRLRSVDSRKSSQINREVVCSSQ